MRFYVKSIEAQIQVYQLQHNKIPSLKNWQMKSILQLISVRMANLFIYQMMAQYQLGIVKQQGFTF